MTRCTSIIAALLCIVGCSSPARKAPKSDLVSPPPSAVERVKVLSIVGTNDLHGHIEMLPILGGYLDILRHDPERAVVLIDGGDMFQGTLASNLVEGAPIVKAYELLGYNAVTIGNHEFDFGPVGPDATVQREGQDPRGALKARASEAAFPFLSANILEEGQASVSWPNVSASTIVKVKGIAIGIIGVTTYETPQVTLSANFVGLSMAPLVETITEEAAALRQAGAEFVVVAAHAGGICKDLSDAHQLASCDANQEIFEVARALPKGSVQAIVAGHTHQGVAHEVAGIPIIESFARGQAFGRIDFHVGPSGSIELDRIHPPRNLCVDDASATCEAGEYEGVKVKPNAAVAAIATEAEGVATEIRSQRLGVELTAPLRRSRENASPLGNLFADLMLAAQPGAQVAITNGGSLRADLPAGPLLYGSLFEAMPFDNRFAMVKLDAKDLAKLIAINLQRDSGILSIAGVQAKARCAGKQLEVALTDSKGRKIPDGKSLVVATSDFLASGGDGLFSGPSIEVDMSSGTLIRDAMAEQLRKRGGQIAPGDTMLFNPSRPRIGFTGTRPLRCP